MGISTDFIATLSHWSKEINLTYPLASDHMRKVTGLYGVLNPGNGLASRTTFVIDPDGKIQHIEEGSSAVDPTGAETACKRIQKK